MHLMEMSRLRTVPGAGLFMALTRRCPLSCAHCSTESSLAVEQHSADPFRHLVQTFTPGDHPEILALSGGEALLRAALVSELATAARDVGCRTYLLSGMYFARGWHSNRRPAIPKALTEAIANVDHFSASLDVFHEREVSRGEVFAAMRAVGSLGPSLSFQLTGLHPGDPYLEDLIRDIRVTFADQIPILVGFVKPHGRAKQLAPEMPRPTRHYGVADPEPCDAASWPLVTFDGTVLACCNQQLVDAMRPPHLVLGHALNDDWTTLRTRHESRALLRGIRSFGPRYVAAMGGRHCEEAVGGYCESCTKLSDTPQAELGLAAYLASPSGTLVEGLIHQARQAAPPDSMIARRSPGYESLLDLGVGRVAG